VIKGIIKLQRGMSILIAVLLAFTLPAWAINPATWHNQDYIYFEDSTDTTVLSVNELYDTITIHHNSYIKYVDIVQSNSKTTIRYVLENGHLVERGD